VAPVALRGAAVPRACHQQPEAHGRRCRRGPLPVGAAGPKCFRLQGIIHQSWI